MILMNHISRSSLADSPPFIRLDRLFRLFVTTCFMGGVHGYMPPWFLLVVNCTTRLKTTNTYAHKLIIKGDRLHRRTGLEWGRSAEPPWLWAFGLWPSGLSDSKLWPHSLLLLLPPSRSRMEFDLTQLQRWLAPCIYSLSSFPFFLGAEGSWSLLFKASWITALFKQ